MYAVGMLGSYLTQGVYAVAGPFQPFGGAVDIIVVQQEDGSFKSSPWYVKFGDFQGVLKREKVVDIAVNDAPADFHMCLDYKGEAYFEKEVESDEGTCLALPDTCSLTGDNGAEGEMESPASPDASSLTGDNRINGETESPALPDASSLFADNRVEEEPERLADAAMVVNASSHCQEAIHSKTESNPQLQKVSTPPKQNGMVDDGFCPEEKGATKEGKLETQDPSNYSNVGLKEDSVLSNMSTQAGLENPKALSTSIDPEAIPTQNDNDCMHEIEASNSLTMTVENSLNLTEASLTHIGLVETARSETVVTEDGTFQSSSVLTVEEGSCLQAVTFSDGGVVDGLSSNAKVDVDGGRLLVDVWTEEAIEANGDYKNGCISLEEEEVFGRIECMTVEGEREMPAYTGKENITNDLLDGLEIQEMSKDTLVWNSESPLNHDLGDVALAISHNTTFLLEEKNEGTNIDGGASENEFLCQVDESSEGKTIDGAAGQAIHVSVSSPSRWRLWPFSFRRSSIEKGSLSTSLVPEQDLLAAANVAIGSPFTEEELLRKNVYLKWQPKTKVRTYVPTSAQLASLKLKDGPNKVTFTFSTVLGKTEVNARIYLWKWNTRIVISDVDGTITKSDVLGQVMPLVGRDWSQSGVTRLFSAIKDNGFEVLFLSARAISQAYLTRRFLLNLKQDGEALPEGPVFISPDGLLPSLYREVIRRAPHEFKIACLEGIRELFPKDVNPFYAGFGNRETDEISYLKVGIPKGKIFIINPKGEVVVNHRVDCKSYPSLHALVDEMFPPMSSHEPEDFNAWNYWKIPLPDIDEEELSTSGSKNAKKSGSFKK